MIITVHDQCYLLFTFDENMQKVNDLDNHSTTLLEEVSNVWSMGKDGKYYFSLVEQLELFEQIANKRGNNPQERSSLKKRLLHKWTGK